MQATHSPVVDGSLHPERVLHAQLRAGPLVTVCAATTQVLDGGIRLWVGQYGWGGAVTPVIWWEIFSSGPAATWLLGEG
jgi:hypothetical protein